MVNHAYLKGFSILPDLKKIQSNQVFESDRSDSILIQEEKRFAMARQIFFLEHEISEEIYEDCEKFILDNYPVKLEGRKYSDIAKEIDEDLIIHRSTDNRNWMASGHVCLPSGWDPSQKIGMSFDELHTPVPMSLKNSDKIVNAIINAGIFERYLWSVVHEKKYNYHPIFEFKKFDKNNPELFVKIERQVTVGFPDKGFCLFILRQYLIDEKDIDKKSLIKTISNMTTEQKKYKGLEDSDDLLDYLGKHIS